MCTAFQKDGNRNNLDEGTIIVENIVDIGDNHNVPCWWKK